MSLKTKQIEVLPYNPEWPKLFEREATLIKQALPTNLIGIHHVGSTAVPGLAAKPTIDIIAVIKDPQGTIPRLEQAGYTYNGEWNIPFKYGFSKRGDVRVNLHAFEEGHPEIELNLLFRDYLRNHPEVRDAYANLKYTLLENEKSFEKNNSMFAGYTLGKASFINEILNKSGFEGLRFLRCTHPHEWEAYHRIRKIQIFDPIPVSYDPNHPTITAENHFHFILCKGTQGVSVAHVEFLSQNEAALRSLATDEPYKNQGFGTYLLCQVERWVKCQGRPILKMHAALRAEDFYRKRGYTDMPFDDPCINDAHCDLGKVL